MAGHGSLLRIEPADTLDTAIRHLHGLQADGWSLTTLTTHIDYGQPSPTTAAIPHGATITITVRPAGR